MNLKKRLYDDEITRYTPHKKVKQNCYNVITRNKLSDTHLPRNVSGMGTEAGPAGESLPERVLAGSGARNGSFNDEVSL